MMKRELVRYRANEVRLQEGNNDSQFNSLKHALPCYQFKKAGLPVYVLPVGVENAVDLQ